MSLKTWLAKIYAKYRCEYLMKIHSTQAFQTQNTLLNKHIQSAQKTQFGTHHNFDKIHSYDDYKEAVPIRDYEQFKPYIDAILNGESDILWKGKPLYLAKTSGTTSGTKYIPITKEALPYHINGARDLLLFYIHTTGKSSFLDGKMMFLSGSPELEKSINGIKVGRLSGIVHHYVPSYLQKNKSPSYVTNCIDDWETKIDAILEETKSLDLRLISGIPPWVQMFFEKLAEKYSKSPTQNWKQLSVFIHGGVDYHPYQPIFDRYFQGKIDVLEVYPASEGFIAYQNDINDEGLLLLLNYGIFYEFIPLEKYHDPIPPRITLENVELNKNYIILLSTNSGLWSYVIGDTIKFTSLNPFKIRVTGRIKYFISAFGEHVIEEEVNHAITVAAEICKTSINEFTVAPYISDECSFHEWWIEFISLPSDFDKFAEVIDQTLQEKNSYYADLRKGSMLSLIKIQKMPLYTVRKYMDSIGKLGGQNKFPHLSNDRIIINKLKELIK